MRERMRKSDREGSAREGVRVRMYERMCGSGCVRGYVRECVM